MSFILDPLFASAQQLAVAAHLLLAQSTDSDVSGFHYEAQSSGPVANIIALVVAVLLIVTMWKIFTKAGRPGWASLIPFYNAYVLLKIAGKPGWWLILFIIPLVNVVIFILLGLGLASAFGKGAGFGIGIAFLGFIFLPILAFDGSRYQGALPAPAL